MEVDGAWRVMVFITNNLDWSPRSVCDLYRRRWDIEVSFKQVKQSLKLGSFCCKTRLNDSPPLTISRLFANNLKPPDRFHFKETMKVR